MLWRVYLGWWAHSIFFTESRSDFAEEFSPVSTADLSETSPVEWQLQLRDDEIALEFDEKFHVVFVPDSSRGETVIQQLESLGTYIRSTATITILDNDGKNYCLRNVHVY